CYLDHAGASLYSQSQIQKIFMDISNNLYMNPHASKTTEDAIDIIRYQILDHFNTNNEEYCVIFTSGATAALKTIGECFNYGEDPGTLAYLENNHTSVLGMRNFAQNSTEVRMDTAFKLLAMDDTGDHYRNAQSNSLFCLPCTVFEDGTLSFLSILAIKYGFDTIKSFNLNFNIISQHTFSLAQYVYRNLLVLHHYNGSRAVILYQDTTFEDRNHQGGIINFNLLRPNGEYIGYSEVLQVANLHGIHLRTGCSCNPGACQRFLNLSTQDVLKHFDAGHICGDQYDLVDNYPTGSVRISFGYMSKQRDADKFLNMIETCFVQKPTIRKLPTNWSYLKRRYKDLFSQTKNKNHRLDEFNEEMYIASDKCYECEIDEGKVIHKTIGTLQGILVYPVKSCGALRVQKSWPITSTGLKYDREWMIVNHAGVCLTQKHNKKLCLINPQIDLKKDSLKLQFKGFSEIEVSSNISRLKEKSAYFCQSKVCGDRIQGYDCGEEVAEWLSKTLETPGLRLLKQCNSCDKKLGRISRKDTTPQLSLVNKAQYLLINSASVKWLMDKITDSDFEEDIESVIQRFRPNFVVNFSKPFQENKFESFTFDENLFTNSGEISKEPLLTLSREFKGKVKFGVYLNQDIQEENVYISIGSKIVGNSKIE
ncbi:hypothetical protein NQ317_015411, partial [Molorchus minor]